MAKKKTKKVQKKKEPVKQLSLGLRSPIVNVFYDFKEKIEKRFTYLNTNRYIKDPFIWFLISFQVVLILTQVVTTLDKFSKLPSLISVMGYFDSFSSTILPKYVLFAFPFISLLFFVLSLRMSRRAYFTNKYLATFIPLFLFVCILAITLHILKILLPFYG